jgi:hypothetical protein
MNWHELGQEYPPILILKAEELELTFGYFWVLIAAQLHRSFVYVLAIQDKT